MRYNYEHGYTSRAGLNSDADSIRRILREHKKEEDVRVNCALEYANEVIGRLNANNKFDVTKEDKKKIIDYLLMKKEMMDDKEIERIESEIRRILFKYKDKQRNRMSGWLRHQREEFNKRD